MSLVVNLVNISSTLIEDPPGHRSFHAWEPWSWELSSFVAFGAVLPGLYWFYRRFHWSGRSLPRFLAWQVAGWVYYSLAHDVIMVAIRHGVYALLGEHYYFSHGNLPLVLVYEGRKDALAVALMTAIFWADEKLRSQSAKAEPPPRIEVKSDGRTQYLTPAEILYAEAAGNYVELHLVEAKPLLLRGTLADYERRLAPYGFIRVHRSRLLNRSHIRSFTVTPSGDLRIVLEGGREITASRRYREALETAA
ncbi:MAG: LytTR family transcriptional regulator [Asticcacaulis sp.]|nr:LytTR family transcriptional regulator [Asticcacaulis sp.]